MATHGKHPYPRGYTVAAYADKVRFGCLRFHKPVVASLVCGLVVCIYMHYVCYVYYGVRVVESR